MLRNADTLLRNQHPQGMPPPSELASVSLGLVLERYGCTAFACSTISPESSTKSPRTPSTTSRSIRPRSSPLPLVHQTHPLLLPLPPTLSHRCNARRAVVAIPRVPVGSAQSATQSGASRRGGYISAPATTRTGRTSPPSSPSPRPTPSSRVRTTKKSLYPVRHTAVLLTWFYIHVNTSEPGTTRTGRTPPPSSLSPRPTPSSRVRTTDTAQ
jgi:hypothetical protein